MQLQQRIELLVQLGAYMKSENEDWLLAKEKASRANGWFEPVFIDRAVNTIANAFLDKEKLKNWIAGYALPETNPNPKTVGIVMAGNIPLVGFHDWLCVFITGHHALVKTSSKDEILFPHLINWLIGIEPALEAEIRFETLLKGADAYIATGSNNSARYFELYFSKYPHIIRRNRTSVAILTGKETPEELSCLADDIHLYFGMGCRNVTKIFVPEEYDFVPLLKSFEPYRYFFDHPKFRSNYDYQLAIRILNKQFYMTRDTVVLVESPALFAPVAVLHYNHYSDAAKVKEELRTQEDLQCLVGTEEFPFGVAQQPSLSDYADGVDTLKFLQGLSV